ncbi:hypothetical protein [Deinococcus altitudinis]|uniref:hypothetical protein n=1 Tax=Deinococcus altitudinis TaxID=468914 RepID=UPI0038926A08
MPLLSTTDLAAPLTPDQALARAETLVASAICPALPDLGVRQWAADYRIRNDDRALGIPLYGRRRLGPMILRYWPITGLTLVSQDGTDLTSQCAFDTFTVRRDALAPEFQPLSTVHVEFQTGWTAENLPHAVREAILLTAREIQAVPEGVSSKRIGDVQVTFERSVSASGIPAAAQTLIAPWRFLGA